MTVLIVAESYFGNTQAIAKAIAAGLGRSLNHDAISIVHPNEAPHELDHGIRLLLVGAPTHDYSMPKPHTRSQAAAKGGAGAAGIGIQEWIKALTPRPDLRVITFDTSLEMRFTLGSASKAAARVLKKQGFRHVERGESFRVAGTAGPLIAGEESRAKAWGQRLAASLLTSPAAEGSAG